jgi:hypothetical protein
MSGINEELGTIFVHVPKVAGGSLSNFPWSKGNGHKTIADYEVELGDKLKDYFVWAFVRNPWDRIVSAYEDCPEIFPYAPTFADFIRQIYDHKEEVETIEQIRFTTLPKFGFPFGRIHFLPMHLMLRGKDKKIRPNFIGKFENLNHDFERLQRKLGIKPAILPHHNARKNKQNRRTSYWRDVYTPEIIFKVGEIYAQDAQDFGYGSP